MFFGNKYSTFGLFCAGAGDGNAMFLADILHQAAAIEACRTCTTPDILASQIILHCCSELFAEMISQRGTFLGFISIPVISNGKSDILNMGCRRSGQKNCECKGFPWQQRFIQLQFPLAFSREGFLLAIFPLFAAVVDVCYHMISGVVLQREFCSPSAISDHKFLEMY